jgi:LPS-assembly protein
LKRKRYVIILALWLFYSPMVKPALAAVDEVSSDAPEVRLPVTPPPAPVLKDVREIRLDVSPKPTPAAPKFAQSVEIPTAGDIVKPVFDEKDLLKPSSATPSPPNFPGYTTNGPELRMGVTPPAKASAAPGQKGQPKLAVSGGAQGEEHWDLTADRIIGQHGSEYLEAVGKATLVSGLNSLKADFIRYYQGSRWVILRGNVRVLWEGEVLEAEEAEFDLSSMQGWLKHGKVYVSKSNVHVQTEYARRDGASTYRFQNAKFTGCDGETPAWSFSAKEGELDLNGRTKLYGSHFNVLDQPVVYTPYLSLPGNGRRQSGLLTPDISHSSLRGYSVNQPYFWAIDAEHDLTYYENVMSSRGLMQGLEYRHAENARTKGDWRIDYLNDARSASQLYKQESDLQLDGLTRSNSNRWWLRSKYDGFVVDPAWTFKLDLDIVSDQDYLREFSSGSSGYDASNTAFLKEFGRGLDVADSLTRTSTAFVARSWDKFGVTAKVAWTENLSYMNGNNFSSKDPTTQSLPEINAFIFKDALAGTPFDFDASGRFNYFWRQYGTRSTRMDLHPTLSMPLSLGPVTLIPTAGVETTSYGVGGYTNEPATTTTNKTPTRAVVNLGFTGFTEFSRVYNLRDTHLEALPENIGKSEWGAVRHSVEPRLEYAYLPVTGSQDRLPYFDSLDRLTRKNTITYSLTNVFDRRRTTVGAAPGAPGTNSTVPAVSTDYLDFLRLRLEESYDRDEAARTESLSTYARRPFSDIMLETSVRPEKFLTLTSRSYYSPYLHRFTEHENQLTLNKEKLGELRLGHDYLNPVHEYTRDRSNNVQVLTLGADYYITDKLKFVSNYQMDIAAHSDLYKTAAFVWRDQCYEIELKYIKKPTDQDFELRVNLLDFGKP